MISDPDRGYRKLWEAVFVRNVSDAMRGNQYHKDRAIQWLFDDAHRTDREEVCDMAGLPPEGWQRSLRKVISNDDGTGLRHTTLAELTVAKKFFARLSSEGVINYYE